jgi:hypothetical protein
MQRLGFDKRVSGGHHIFRKEGVLERSINKKKVTRPSLIKSGKLEISF